MKTLQHLILALAGGALLVALAFIAWPGGGSRAPVTALAPAPAAVQAVTDSVTSAPVDAPAATVAPVAASDEATAPAASPDIDASDTTADRERAAQQSARAR